MNDAPSQEEHESPPPSLVEGLSEEPEQEAYVSPEQVGALIERAKLREIRLARWHGEAPPGTEGPVEDVEARLEPARMRVTADHLSLWFEHRVDCRNATGESVAEIETGVILDFDMAAGPEPELPVVACFADTNGAFMAWPYIREAVQSMSVRLGLAPVTLGILQRDADAYGEQEA